ncbi:MAG TPA: hypothetical protein VIS71_12340 [Terrimicrobium sp.]
MSSDYFIAFFLLFAASALFLWLLGAAAFSRDLGMESVFRAPWLGYALLVGLLQIGHLFFPVHARFAVIFVSAAVFAAGGALLLGGATRVMTKKGVAAALAGTVFLLGVSLLAFIPVFNGCTKSMCHIDLGLYYLKLIRWIQTFPIVPGLVNVQEQLAFNQNAFLVTSLFDSLVPNRWGIFLIAGFLAWLGLSLSVFAIFRLVFLRLQRRESAQAIEVAYAISLPVWISTQANFSTSSASPDCIISSLSIHFFLVFACFVVSKDERQRARHLGEILILGALCLSVKSSSIALVLGAWAVALALLVIEKRRNFYLVFLQGRVAAMSLLAAVLLATWMGRGIVLSGYPLFPSTALAMPVAWRMPVKGILEFQGEILRWARDPDPGSDPKKVIKTWRWLPGWCERIAAMRTHFAWPAQIGIAGSAVLVSFSFCVSAFRRKSHDLLLLVIPLAVYSTFWFISAPDPRYFGSTMWIFAICPALAFAAEGLRVGLASSLAILGAAAIPISLLLWEFRQAWTYAEERLPEFSVVETNPVTNPHGVVLWMNPDGIQTYDSPLPSSWKPRPFLALLNPDKGIAGGFKYLKVENPAQP